MDSLSWSQDQAFREGFGEQETDEIGAEFERRGPDAVVWKKTCQAETGEGALFSGRKSVSQGGGAGRRHPGAAGLMSAFLLVSYQQLLSQAPGLLAFAQIHQDLILLP